MSYVTNQKSLQADSMYSLQSFTILLWSPSLRKCSSLGLHVAELQNGFIFIPPFSQGHHCFLHQLHLFFMFLGSPYASVSVSLLSLILMHDIVVPNLIPYFVSLQSSCRKSYCSCALVCPHHHTGSAYRLQH